MKNALILIDIQNDYFPGGKMELVNMLDATKKAKQLLEQFRKNGDPVIHIQHIANNEGASFFLPETDGAEIHELVKPAAGEALIIKHTPNSFNQTNLHEQLQKLGVDTVTIVGAMTHVCVDSTARAAFDLGYQAIVIADATATRDLSMDGVMVPAKQVQAAYLAGLSFVFAKVQNAAAN